MESKRAEAKDLESAYIESTLLSIQELRNNLITQIAHNFRTPLTSVIGFAEMLVDDRPLTDEQRVEYARFIQYEGIRLTKLIDDVLALSSLQRGETKLVLVDCSVQEVVEESIRSVADFARNRFVTVTASFPVSRHTIPADRSRIIQAVYQLLHNAVRFTRPHEEVSVRIVGAGTNVGIQIQDRGPGIGENELAVLLPGADAKAHTDITTRGTCVGLAIVRHIMDLHKGTIDVQTRAGEGSTFTLWIPGGHE